MIFAAPLVLLGLIALPALYFLLRATPPAPSRQIFPAVRLLRDLAPTERTPARMPLWLLLLRLCAAGLVIIGLADPQTRPKAGLPGTGPILLVIDNGFATAADWPARLDAARAVMARARQEGRRVALLPTAANPSGQVQLAADLSDIAPRAWPSDRAADRAAVGAALAKLNQPTRIYIADGLTDGPFYPSFFAALNPALTITAGSAAARLLLPATITSGGALRVHLAIVARPGLVDQPVLAENAAGAALARVQIRIPPGASQGSARFDLPFALQASIARLALPGSAGPGGIFLLDSAAKSVAVGLVAGGEDSDRKFLGSAYYIRRALPAGSVIRTGPIDDLIKSGVNAIILVDQILPQPAITALTAWMDKGGVLIRFAGPLTAATPDSLSPDPLLQGDRSLGGALSWSKPAPIAQFAAGGPLAGLALPHDATVSRQILADPARLDQKDVWASLADGTPIILGRHEGSGALVSILTTANDDWSNWPLSGSFPQMLARLIDLARATPPPSDSLLAPLEQLDGEGQLIAPSLFMQPIRAADLDHIAIAPTHPPGFYGAAGFSRALNIGGHVPALAAAPLPAHAQGLTGQPAPRAFGADLLAAAFVLLLADFMISLILRGLIGRFAIALAVILLLPGTQAHAQSGGQSDAPAGVTQGVPAGALAATLAYVRTDNAATDALSAAGLTALAGMVNAQTAAQIAPPVGVVPGQDDIGLYPMLYWPVIDGAPKPDEKACTALQNYMQDGGLLVIDTQGGDAAAPGSGAGFAPDATAILHADLACLPIPPLRKLSGSNTLAHAFYLLSDFPGRFDGAPVFVAAKGGQDADDTSPVVIGGNDWAGGWAADATGAPLQSLLPGSSENPQDQRVLADRFGVNLVIYALTGTYKSDQLQIPELLRRLNP